MLIMIKPLLEKELVEEDAMVDASTRRVVVLLKLFHFNHEPILICQTLGVEPQTHVLHLPM